MSAFAMYLEIDGQNICLVHRQHYFRVTIRYIRAGGSGLITHTHTHTYTHAQSQCGVISNNELCTPLNTTHTRDTGWASSCTCSEKVFGKSSWEIQHINNNNKQRPLLLQPGKEWFNVMLRYGYIVHCRVLHDNKGMRYTLAKHNQSIVANLEFQEPEFSLAHMHRITQQQKPNQLLHTCI